MLFLSCSAVGELQLRNNMATIEKFIVTINGKSLGLLPLEVAALSKVLNDLSQKKELDKPYTTGKEGEIQIVVTPVHKLP